MAISDRTPAIQSHFPVRNYDGWIILGYAVFGAVALGALYLTFWGPGMIDVDLAMATAMP
jgi:hypothetical protein